MAFRNFKDVVPDAELEPDRTSWKPGEVIAVTGVIITTQTKFEKLAKINGIDPKTQEFIKKRTTAGPAIQDLENLMQAVCAPDGRVMGDPVLCKLIEKKSGNGKTSYFRVANAGS